MEREALLAQTLVELADNLVDEFDIVELLTLLTDRCVALLDVSAAGLMLADPGQDLAVVAYSSDAMRLLELLELETQEGPCVDCYRTGIPVVNQDLADAADRWPRVTPAVRAAGFESVHALPLRLRGDTIGALNLFRAGTGRLSEADVAAGRALADIATITILQYNASLEARVLNEQLTQALRSRIVIEQAKGVLAEAAQLDMGEAFDRLRHYARSHNLRLTDVAQAIVDRRLSADLDPPPRSAR
jgi:transcriptional regulator with GAF, ATPase, and Fis domain